RREILCKGHLYVEGICAWREFVRGGSLYEKGNRTQGAFVRGGSLYEKGNRTQGAFVRGGNSHVEGIRTWREYVREGKSYVGGTGNRFQGQTNWCFAPKDQTGGYSARVREGQRPLWKQTLQQLCGRGSRASSNGRRHGVGGEVR